MQRKPPLNRSCQLVMCRHGPKPGCQEAEAFSILEAEALTLFRLEAEAKAEARLFVENQALVNHEAEAF